MDRNGIATLLLVELIDVLGGESFMILNYIRYSSCLVEGHLYRMHLYRIHTNGLVLEIAENFLMQNF